MFLASDDALQRDQWEKRLKETGLHPWFLVQDQEEKFRSALPALVDWRVLTYSRGVVFFSASSFGEEAPVAVNGGISSIGLDGSQWSRWSSKIGEYGKALATYPQRNFVRNHD